VPLTYRGAPLDGAEDALVGTTEHGVLGRRWVYDGTREGSGGSARAAGPGGRGEHGLDIRFRGEISGSATQKRP